MTSATHNHAGVEVTQTLTLQESVVRVGLAKRALAMELTESGQAGRDSRARAERQQEQQGEEVIPKMDVFPFLSWTPSHTCYQIPHSTSSYCFLPPTMMSRFSEIQQILRCT